MKLLNEVNVKMHALPQKYTNYLWTYQNKIYKYFITLASFLKGSSFLWYRFANMGTRNS